MPLFEIIPIDGSVASVTLKANDAHHIFNIIAGFPGREADIWQDGEYKITARQDENRGWMMVRRHHSNVRKMWRPASEGSRSEEV